jgi:hypothetical protein
MVGGLCVLGGDDGMVIEGHVISTCFRSFVRAFNNLNCILKLTLT